SWHSCHWGVACLCERRVATARRFCVGLLPTQLRFRYAFSMIASNHRARFWRALQRFDEENSKDPNTELVDGRPWPRELLYAKRLYDWVLRLDSNASETLLLAARSQHLCRWAIPRNKFEMTKPGYLKWRNELKKFHAQR